MISGLRSQLNLQTRELKHVKVQLNKAGGQPGKRTILDSEDMALKELWNADLLRDEIRQWKQKLNQEREDKQLLKIEMNRLRKYLASLKNQPPATVG